MMRRIAIVPMTARNGLICALALAAALLAACGQQLDRTGKAVRDEPVVLTLANHKGGAVYVQAWADAVQRLTGGSIRVRIANSWRAGETDYEQATLEDVRSGKVPLAIVDARAYDEVGVTSFQPLVAPLLIDSRELERRVLRSDIGRQALAGTKKLGLVGLALLPTESRRLVGLARVLRAPDDFRGARIYTREGKIASATFQALGAQPVHQPSEDWAESVDAAELGMDGLRGAPDAARRAAGVTANVVLWPMPMTVVINRQTFDGLSDAQQTALRQAAADEAFDRDNRFVAELEDENIDAVCGLGTKLVDATAAQLAALKTAVQPAYRTIERGAGNRAAIERIRALKGDEQPDVLSCRGQEAAGTQPTQAARELEGTYRTSFSEEELAESSLLTDAGEINDENWGDFTLRLSNGRFRLKQRNARAHSEVSGRYNTDGDAIEVRSISTGETFAYRWSLYRGTLKFERDEELGVGPTPWLVKPWRRVR
jgi:TRAP-type C4-dicarboxylate transport system substrate-binding protein